MNALVEAHEEWLAQRSVDDVRWECGDTVTFTFTFVYQADGSDPGSVYWSLNETAS